MRWFVEDRGKDIKLAEGFPSVKLLIHLLNPFQVILTPTVLSTYSIFYYQSWSLLTSEMGLFFSLAAPASTGITQ